MKKRKELIYTETFLNNKKYYDIDIELIYDTKQDEEIINFWISNQEYGIKMHMFGIPYSQEETKELREIILKNIREYIAIYQSDYEGE